ncbi:hypothetical protein B0H17DRAFT_1175245, partial [Mycena rosella]
MAQSICLVTSSNPLSIDLGAPERGSDRYYPPNDLDGRVLKRNVRAALVVQQQYTDHAQVPKLGWGAPPDPSLQHKRKVIETMGVIDDSSGHGESEEICPTVPSGSEIDRLPPAKRHKLLPPGTIAAAVPLITLHQIQGYVLPSAQEMSGEGARTERDSLNHGHLGHGGV